MTMKAILTYTLGLATVLSATAQKAENDDMYFTSKDRVKTATVSANTKVQVSRTPETSASANEVVGINPTDSYSARSVNPEYSASTSTGKSKESSNYFIENYNPTGVNGNLNGNYRGTTSYSNPYANPYSYGYYGNSFGYGGYSPYMGMGYNPYMMGMGGFGYPMYGSRFSMSMGTSFGYNPMMYGSMGYGYGYGSAWGNPWGMYDPFYSPFYSMSCPYSFYGYNSFGNGWYGYPGSVIIVNNDGRSYDGRKISQQRRSDRSSSTNFQTENTRTTTGLVTRNGREIAGGRTRSTDARPYYEKDWRGNTNAAGTTTRSQWGTGTTTGSNPGITGSNSSGRTSSWGSWETGSSIHDGGSQSQPRSTWSPSGGGGSRSSVGTVGGGGSTGGGRSRGRD